MIEHKCQFLDIKNIKRIPHPKFFYEETAVYTLARCIVCGQLFECRRGPDEDRWGTCSYEEIKITLEEAKQRFSITEDEIKELLVQNKIMDATETMRNIKCK